MEGFVKGRVIVVPFPFSDLSASKKRPALVVGTIEGEDVILCQITSKTKKDNYSIQLSDKDFKEDGLKIDSMIRPNRLFTAEKPLILYRVGLINDNKIKEVEDVLVKIIRS